VLFNPQPVVRPVLEKTHIPEIINICDTMEEPAATVREVARKSSSQKSVFGPGWDPMACGQ
jgi:hypothetical protein